MQINVDSEVIAYSTPEGKVNLEFGSQGFTVVPKPGVPIKQQLQDVLNFWASQVGHPLSVYWDGETITSNQPLLVQPVQDFPPPPEAPAPEVGHMGAHEDHSLLTVRQHEAPAKHGLRGALNSLPGVHVKPGRREMTQREQIALVSKHWAGPRTIAVVNGKGGSNKTPTTILLSALFARFGGSGVLAWDNNSTRGTLGWRTDQAAHERTVLDLLPHAEDFLRPDANSAHLAHYLHHQTLDKYDVLRSHPEVLSSEQNIGANEFNRLMEVAQKYFRLIFIDSGNDESAASWLAMIERTNQLVVATTTREEHAESGRLLLEELSRRGDHAANLAQKAVIIVSQATPSEEKPERLVAAFSQLSQKAVGVPYDKAMSGRPLHLDGLAKSTQDAWLAAAAEIAKNL